MTQFDKAEAVVTEALHDTTSTLGMSYQHGSVLLGEILEAKGRVQAAAEQFKTALTSLKRIAPTHPLVGRVSCCLSRCLLKLQQSPTEQARALDLLLDCFVTYDHMYDARTMDLVVPSIVMGQADTLAEDLGRLCKRITTVMAARPEDESTRHRALIPLDFAA